MYVLLYDVTAASLYFQHRACNNTSPVHMNLLDVDVERKQAQAIASLPDSITHYCAYSNGDFTVISLRLPVP